MATRQQAQQPLSSSPQFDLGNVVSKIRDLQELSPTAFLRKASYECDVSEQTIRNLMAGKSVNARVLTSFIEAFVPEEEEELRREILLAFLKSLLPEKKRDRLFSTAKIQR